MPIMLKPLKQRLYLIGFVDGVNCGRASTSHPRRHWNRTMDAWNKLNPSLRFFDVRSFRTAYFRAKRRERAEPAGGQYELVTAAEVFQAALPKPDDPLVIPAPAVFLKVGETVTVPKVGQLQAVNIEDGATLADLVEKHSQLVGDIPETLSGDVDRYEPSPNAPVATEAIAEAIAAANPDIDLTLPLDPNEAEDDRLFLIARHYLWPLMRPPDWAEELPPWPRSAMPTFKELYLPEQSEKQWRCAKCNGVNSTKYDTCYSCGATKGQNDG